MTIYYYNIINYSDKRAIIRQLEAAKNLDQIKEVMVVYLDHRTIKNIDDLIDVLSS